MCVHASAECVVAVGRDAPVPRRPTRLQAGQVLAGARALRVVVRARSDRARPLHRHRSPDEQPAGGRRHGAPALRRRLGHRLPLRRPAAAHLRLRRARAARLGRLRLLGSLPPRLDAAALHHVVRRGRLPRSAAAARRRLRPDLLGGLAHRRRRAAAPVVLPARRGHGPRSVRRRPGQAAAALDGGVAARRAQHPPPVGRPGGRAQSVPRQDEDRQADVDRRRQLRHLLGPVHRRSALVRMGPGRAV